MFNFQAPRSAGYLKAVEQARLVNGARKELQALKQGKMLEFADTAALEVAIDREVVSQRNVAVSGFQRRRAVA